MKKIENIVWFAIKNERLDKLGGKWEIWKNLEKDCWDLVRLKDFDLGDWEVICSNWNLAGIEKLVNKWKVNKEEEIIENYGSLESFVMEMNVNLEKLNNKYDEWLEYCLENYDLYDFDWEGNLIESVIKWGKEWREKRKEYVENLEIAGEIDKIIFKNGRWKIKK